MTRIINRQRQLAEQGRLRLGFTVPAKTKDGRDTTRPVRSETWILTSHSKEHIEHAAALWGGDVEHWEPMGNGAKQWRVITKVNAIAAILPPGDPLTQAYEQWNKGGCVRRCNGATESFTGNPCLCLAQHGDTWYELSAREVCQSKSRLKVLLPDMPGLGSWRMETGSFYATDEIAGMVDTIRGAVGPTVLVPVTLRIEPRTRVAGGQTKQFVVPVVELRGVTAGALLSGQAIETRALQSVEQVTAPAALEAGRSASSAGPVGGSAEDAYTKPLELVAAAEDHPRLVWIWDKAKEMHLVGTGSPESDRKQEFVDAWKARAHEIQDGGQPPAAPDADGAFPIDVVDEGSPGEVDADAVWQKVLAVAGQKWIELDALTDMFKERMGGLLPDEATGPELQQFLTLLEQDDAA